MCDYNWHNQSVTVCMHAWHSRLHVCACACVLFVLFLLSITGRDRKSRSSLDRCAPVFRGSNKCVCVCECVNVQGMWRERGAAILVLSRRKWARTQRGCRLSCQFIHAHTHKRTHTHTHTHTHTLHALPHTYTLTHFFKGSNIWKKKKKVWSGWHLFHFPTKKIYHTHVITHKYAHKCGANS